MREPESLFPPVAIVGVASLFPNSQEPFGFWRDILLGKDLITEVPPHYWLVEDVYDPDPRVPDKAYCKRGGFFREPVVFDCMEYGILPKYLEHTDVTQLLSLWVAKRALADATGGDLSRLDKKNTSVFIGVSGALQIVTEAVQRGVIPIARMVGRQIGFSKDEEDTMVERVLSYQPEANESSFPGGLANITAGRIANHFDLQGTNCTVDAACGSSFAALKMALMELWSHQADWCLTGGADNLMNGFTFVCFSKTPALSFSGDCRPFSVDADGTLLGEGLCFFMLRRLEDAVADGNKIYAVIRGIGSSSDGAGTAIYAPKVEGQVLAMERAYKMAGYGPETVELVEAHGTGTAAGDGVEFRSMAQVFRKADPERKQWCALGSVKSQVGHTKGTAGSASLFKAVMSLRHKALPPTLKVKRPDPQFDIDNSPFYLNTRARPWIHAEDYPRRAGVSAFGFGGTNFHVTVEEYTGPGQKAPLFRPSPAELFLVGEDSPKALAEKGLSLLEGREKDQGFRFACRASQLGFDAQAPFRLAIVAEDTKSLKEKIAQAAKQIEKDPQKSFSLPGLTYGASVQEGKVALLFPGQGSQYLTMGSDLAIAFFEARAPWEKARRWGISSSPLDDIVFPRPVFDEEKIQEQTALLTATENTQPALGLVSLGMLSVLHRLGVSPELAAGHSFGELAALHASGVFSEEGFLRAARKRGELMSQASKTPGAMTAVLAPQDKVLSLLSQWQGPVTVANFNSPTQLVLSGTVPAIEEVEARLQQAKLDFKRLPVSTAFHSALVEGAVEPFSAFLEDIAFSAPAFPVYANATAAPYPQDPSEMRSLLSGQLARPVRFVETVQAMRQAGAGVFIEVGPGQVLTQLAKDILKGENILAVALDQKNQHGLTALYQALGQLAAAGVPLRFDALWEDVAPFADPREEKKPRMGVELWGHTYNRRYPPKEGAAAIPPPNPPRQKEAEAAPSAKQPERMPSPVPAQTFQNTGSSALPSRAAHASGAVMNEHKETPPKSAVFPQDNPLSRRAASPPQVNGDAREHGSLASADPPPPAPRVPANGSLGWLAALQDLQRQTTGAHMAFLEVAERSLLALEAAMGGRPRPIEARSVPAARPMPMPETPAAPAPMPVQPSAAMPAFAPESMPAPPAAPAPGFAAESPGPMPAAQTAPVFVPEAPAPVPAVMGMSKEELKVIMLSVVADKTGYPEDMLTMDMDIESDLGIDSIKRVEILSALQERFPEAPTDIDLSEVATLRTLGEVADYLEKHAETLALSASSSSAASVPAVTASAPALVPAQAGEGELVTMSAEEFQRILLEVVADKTGYPADMLEPQMDIETDLGIDSIKRVEILSALQERVPVLPEVDLAEVASLRTIGDIAAYIERMGMEGAAAPALPPAAPAQQALEAAAIPETKTSEAPSPQAPIAVPPIRRFAIELAPMPLSNFVLPRLFDGETVFITPDGSGIAQALASLLAEEGVEARVTQDIPGNARLVVSLDGLGPVANEDAAIAINERVFTLATRLAPPFEKEGGTLVVVQDTGGDFGRTGNLGPRAWLGGLAGLAKSAYLEWPTASVRALDIAAQGQAPEEVARRLKHEFLHGGSDVEVGLASDGRRLRLALVESDIPPDAPSRMGKDAVVVATGGARGVTAACMVELARSSGAKIALLGRTVLEDEPQSCQGVEGEANLKKALLEDARARGETPTPVELGRRASHVLALREIRATLREIEAAGSPVAYFACDVADRQALDEALAQVRQRFGPITALVHGAGVLADKKLSEKTPEHFWRVFSPKVLGLKNLLEATGPDPLSAIVLFSSVAGRFGNMGQGDYAMANEILARVALAEKRRRGDACAVKSIAWGPWESGMVTPMLRQLFENFGVAVIPLKEGASRFAGEIQRGPAHQAEVLVGGGEPKISPSAAVGMPPERRFDILVDAQRYPFIESHRIHGQAVVPTVLVGEWLGRAARSLAPHLVPSVVEELKIVRGLVMADFGQARHVLFLHVKEEGRGRFTGRILDEKGVLRYSGKGLMAESLPPAPAVPPLPEGLEEAHIGPDHVYDGKTLFHGKDFHAIEEIESMGERGFVARAHGALALNWPKEDWVLDLPLLDAALQAGHVWGREKLGLFLLPGSVGMFRLYRPGLAPDRGRWLVRLEPRGRMGASASGYFVDEKTKEVICALENIEVFGVSLEQAQKAMEASSSLAAGGA